MSASDFTVDHRPGAASFWYSSCIIVELVLRESRGREIIKVIYIFRSYSLLTTRLTGELIEA